MARPEGEVMTADSLSPMTRLAEHVAGQLAAFGGTVAFGLPGGGNNLEVIGAAQRRGMQFVLGHTEYAVSVMAAVYGQLTDCPTASIVTRGPGAAAATNGVAQAWLDRQPLVLITDTVSEGDRARVPHQQLDQESLFRPIVKQTIAAGTASIGTEQVASAMRQAMALPRGPVHIDVDVHARAPIAESASPTVTAAPEAAIAAIGELIASSSRPCILLGMGALDAVEEIRAFVEGTEVPVLSSYRAMGVIPDSWPNHAGPFTGATSESDLLANADLIIAIGVDQVELIPNPWDYPAPVVSVASWPETFAYFVAAHEAVGAISELLGRMPRPTGDGWPTAYGSRRVAAARDALLEVASRTPQRIVADANRLAPEGSIATVDAGAHMLAALALWRVQEPNGLLISTGLATMGFAVPAAIAAALASPGRRVVCFVGDGGLSMVEAELETIARLDLPITVIVFNDSTLSLIAMKQSPEGQGGPAAVLYRPTDFAALARAHGLDGVTVGIEDDLESVLTSQFATGGPALIDVEVHSADYRLVMSVTRGAPLIQPD
jgi:acetolactate synthase-1/2/3 large subunit